VSAGCAEDQRPTAGNVRTVGDGQRPLDTGDATCVRERWRFEQVLERIDAKLADLRRVRRDVVAVLEASHAGHCEVCDGRFR
jgi:hypothetical protein